MEVSHALLSLIVAWEIITFEFGEDRVGAQIVNS